jgi:hypothetical protein
VTTASGKKMPLDSKPDPNGNVILRQGVAHVLKRGETPDTGTTRYTSHFSTCPNAQSHRKD